jgi:hypothetical protein
MEQREHDEFGRPDAALSPGSCSDSRSRSVPLTRGEEIPQTLPDGSVVTVGFDREHIVW